LRTYSDCLCTEEARPRMRHDVLHTAAIIKEMHPPTYNIYDPIDLTLIPPLKAPALQK